MSDVPDSKKLFTDLSALQEKPLTVPPPHVVSGALSAEELVAKVMGAEQAQMAALGFSPGEEVPPKK